MKQFNTFNSVEMATKKNPIADISISNEVLVIFSYTPIYCLCNTLSDRLADFPYLSAIAACAAASLAIGTRKGEQDT